MCGMKENRAGERKRERESGKWLLGESQALTETSAKPDNRTPEIEDEQNYAAPSMLNLLRRQRESRWKGDKSVN